MLLLNQLKCNVTVVPYDTSFEKIMELNPDMTDLIKAGDILVLIDNNDASNYIKVVVNSIKIMVLYQVKTKILFQIINLVQKIIIILRLAGIPFQIIMKKQF